MRTNLEALKARCKLICNTCYVDSDVAEDALLQQGLDPVSSGGDDTTITKCAIVIVKGWVETSRSEGGISASINYDAIKKNLLWWANQYGLDADELLADSFKTIEDGSQLW